MAVDPRRIAIIRQHRHWCDRYVVLSIGVILTVFVGAVVVMDQLRIATADRAGMYVMLATIVLAVIIWNAAGMAVVEIHSLLEGGKPG
jgi:hypothetical protein